MIKSILGSLLIFIVTQTCFNIGFREIKTLPNEFEQFRPLLNYQLTGDSMSQIGITILPIVKDNSKGGVYGFSIFGSYRGYNNIFTYDNKNINLFETKDEKKVIDFLKSNDFKHKYQKKFLRRNSKLKQYNKKLYESLVW